MRIQKATKLDVRMKPQIQIAGPNVTLRLDRRTGLIRRLLRESAKKPLPKQIKPQRFIKSGCKKAQKQIFNGFIGIEG